MLAKIKDGQIIQYPYGMAELQADNPYTMFPAFPLEMLFSETEAAKRGEILVEVQPAPRPKVEPSERVVAGNPIKSGDFWKETWVIKPLDGTSLSRLALNLLAASDRTVLRCVEAGIAVPVEWAEYRQKLRSIVTNPTLPLPTQPAYPI